MPYIWNGANDILNEGKWVWSSDGEPIKYQNWNKPTHEPNNHGGNEDCGYFHMEQLAWNDSICGRKFGYICEKQLK